MFHKWKEEVRPTRLLITCIFWILTLNSARPVESQLTEQLVSVSPGGNYLTIRSKPSDLPDSTTKIQIKLKNLLTNKFFERSFTGSQGQYRVINLTPDTWYGLTFKGVSKTGTKEVSGTQYALAHTLPAGGSEGSEGKGKELAIALVSWDESAVIVDWTTSANKAFDIIGDSTLVCNGKNITKTLRLNATHPNGKQNFTLEQKASGEKLLDIKSGKNQTHRWVDMELRAGNCSKFCWKYWIKSAPDTFTFEEQCRGISEVKKRIQLQTIKDVVVGHDQLVIVTNQIEDEKDGSKTSPKSANQDQPKEPPSIQSAFIQHTAVELVDMTRVQKVPEYEFLNQSSFYTISGLDENTWYAMTFKNVLTAPVKYFTEEHSMLKTTGGGAASGSKNGSDASSKQSEYSLASRETKLIHKSNGETVQQSKYALLELKATINDSDIIAEARSLLPETLDLELTIQGSCKLEGVHGKLTQDSPIWTVKFAASDFTPENYAGGGRHLASATSTASPATGGNNNTNVTNHHNSAAIVAKDERSGEKTETGRESSKLARDAGPGGCTSLCWSYNVVIREVDASFPVGIECFPLDSLLDYSSDELNSQRYRDNQPGLKFSKIFTSGMLMLSIGFYIF